MKLGSRKNFKYLIQDKEGVLARTVFTVHCKATAPQTMFFQKALAQCLALASLSDNIVMG